MRHYRFSCLLATLLLMIAMLPFIRFFRTDAFPKLAPFSMVLLFSAVLLSAVYAVSRHRLEIVVARSWVALVIAVQVLYSFLLSEPVLIVEYILSAGLLAYTLFLLLRYLLFEQQVTLEVIAASLCGYLLLGILWAIAFSLLDVVQTDSFSFSLADAENSSDEQATLRFGTERSAMPLYFSYVTLTTLGYGDIVPATPTARMLCTVEAIVGQLYLVVLVARLVGLQIAHAQRGRSS